MHENFTNRPINVYSFGWSKMDKTIANNLLNKYLDCAKLLINETWPADLPEVLDDVIDNAKILSDRIKSRRRPKSRPGAITRSVQRMKNKKLDGLSHAVLTRTSRENQVAAVKAECKCDKRNPRIIMRRLTMANEIPAIKIECKTKMTRSPKRSQSTTLGKENMKTPTEVSETKDEKKSLKANRPNIREDEGKYTRNDGCAIN